MVLVEHNHKLVQLHKNNPLFIKDIDSKVQFIMEDALLHSHNYDVGGKLCVYYIVKNGRDYQICSSSNYKPITETLLDNKIKKHAHYFKIIRAVDKKKKTIVIKEPVAEYKVNQVVNGFKLILSLI